MPSSVTEPGLIVSGPALAAWTVSVLVSLGARADHAEAVARVLVDANLRGVDSHGVARLPAYVRLIDRGLVDLTAEPVVARSDGATALIDARNALGQPAGELGIAEACRLAEELGVGFAVVAHSNHFGTVGYYIRQATDRGLVAFGATNSASVVVPTRARDRHIGTNPLGFGAPAGGDAAINLDMSTSAVAGGKLEKALRENRTIPEGWGLTPEGEHTTDPARVIPAGGGLLPLGGSEEHSSYKGYGLALMVEVLGAVMGGGAHTRGVGPLTSSEPKHPADVSHFFVAVDPGRFTTRDGFAARVAGLCDELRSLEPAEPGLPVLVPGDPEDEMFRARTARGVPIPAEVAAPLRQLGDRVGTELA
jgi:LDH2 family malate/lactate/ureidoglycolate dehydrogenase